MNGTSISVTSPMRLMPPRMTTAVRTASTMPVTTGAMPKRRAAGVGHRVGLHHVADAEGGQRRQQREDRAEPRHARGPSSACTSRRRASSRSHRARGSAARPRSRRTWCTCRAGPRPTARTARPGRRWRSPSRRRRCCRRRPSRRARWPPPGTATRCRRPPPFWVSLPSTSRSANSEVAELHARR